MQVASPFNCGAELRRIALTRALLQAPVTLLDDGPARRRAYAAARCWGVTAAEDAEAIRRALLFRGFVASRAAGAAA